MDSSQIGLVIWILSLIGLYFIVRTAIDHSQLTDELKSLSSKIDTLNETIQHLQDKKSE